MLLLLPLLQSANSRFEGKNRIQGETEGADGRQGSTATGLSSIAYFTPVILTNILVQFIRKLGACLQAPIGYKFGDTANFSRPGQENIT